MLTFCLSLASLAYLSCRVDQRLCPGVDGSRCGSFMSPVFRGPHPTCARCRGRKCSSTTTCDICHDWSLAQWESHHSKRSYAERSKSSNRHAGVPTGPTANSPLSSASKSGAASPAPLTLPAPPPSEGPGVGGETLSDDLKRPCVSPSPSLFMNKQGERGGTWTGGWLRMGIHLPPPPTPLGGGRGRFCPASAIPYSY